MKQKHSSIIGNCQNSNKKMNLKRIASLLEIRKRRDEKKLLTVRERRGKRWEINLFFLLKGSINDLLPDTDAENTVNDIVSLNEQEEESCFCC